MMKSKKRKTQCQHWLLTMLGAVAVAAGVASCSGYDLDEKTPEGWGLSIYDYMAEQGNYSNMVRMIDDLDYRDVLGKTGSKTFFAANDEAFERFYANNAWGVKSYAGLTKSQKRLLVYGAMINNSYQVQTLSSSEGPIEGECMRRLSALTAYDSVPVLKAADMPDNPYWKRYKERGQIVCMKDMTTVPMIHFIEKQLANKKITNEDYNFIYNHTTNRQPGEASVNGVQVAEPNLRCSNGFIHRVEDVMTPLPNMAEIIASKGNTRIFNSLLERFCAPYYCGDDVTLHRQTPSSRNDSSRRSRRTDAR